MSEEKSPQEEEATEVESTEEAPESDVAGDNDESSEEDTSTNEDDEVVKLSKEEHEALLKKASDGENYKKENEKYRTKPKREVPQPKTEEQPDDTKQILLQNDYLSKQADVIDEFKEEFGSLTDEQWSEIEPLITPSMDTVYQKSVEKGNYVAKGELQRNVRKLINFAKGNQVNEDAVKKARVDALKDKTALNNAEIKGVKKKVAPKGDITDADIKYSEESNGTITPQRAAEIRKNKEERLKEYAVPQY